LGLKYDTASREGCQFNEDLHKSDYSLPFDALGMNGSIGTFFLLQIIFCAAVRKNDLQRGRDLVITSLQRLQLSFGKNVLLA
jgi:hypothetical protein